VQQWALFKKLEATKAYKRARNPCKVAVTCLRPYAFRVAAVAVAVSGAEEGSADDVVGWAGAPGSRFQAAKLALMSGLMSWAGKAGALETAGCARVDISLNQTAVCAGACTASTRRSSGASKSARLRRE
jgi:hypothetical protein